MEYQKEISDEFILDLLSNANSKSRGFKLLMEKYQEPLYRHIRRMLSSHEDTDDVLQNTFIKVYRHIDGFKGDSKIFSWLYRIASNETYTFIKKEQKVQKHQSDYQAKSYEAATDVDLGEASLLLEEAIATLPEKQKLVFNLRYYKEMSYKEMSQKLTTTEGALKASFHHAVRKVEDYIKSKL